jgi:hypothetical protein
MQQEVFCGAGLCASIRDPVEGEKLLIQRVFQGLPGLRRLIVAAILAASLSLPDAQANAASVVWQQKDDFVRIEPAEGAKPNLPGNRVPTLSPDAVRAVLSAIKLSGDGGQTPFLDDDQIALVAEPVSRALRSAGPNEDVAFAVHYASIMSMIGPPKTTGGRIFVDGDAVGVIIGQVQESYTHNWVNLDSSKIRTGSRLASQQTNYRVVPNGFVALAQPDRGDWVRVSPAVWLGPNFAAPAAAPMSVPAAPAAAAVPPTPAAAPMPAAPAAPAAAPPPPGIEERFAILKRLYDQHLITEAEYEKSKASLLQGLSTLPPH